MREEIGDELATKLRDTSLAIYKRGREIAEKVGIILADTKFEFGRLPDGTILLIDEVLTPDSSRFWPGDSYAPGRGQPSLDKQPVRDHLEQLVQNGEWNREPPAPDLPSDVVRTTSERYLDAFQRLTGMPLDQFRATDP
jgi:phosphoribosylaminoimidazole-succinocarboxamide synthase